MIEKVILVEYAGEHSTLVWRTSDGDLRQITADDGAMRPLIDMLDLPGFLWIRVSGNGDYVSVAPGPNGKPARYQFPGVSELFEYDKRKVEERRRRVERFVANLKDGR